MKKVIKFIFLILFTLLIVNGCDNPSSKSSKNTEEPIDFIKFIEQQQSDNKIPGIAYAIVGTNSIIKRALGKRDLKNDLNVTPQTLFHIGSTQKSMTAMMAAIYVDEEIFGWESKAIDIYEDFKLSSDVSVTETVNMRHLLNMVSGINGDNEDIYEDYTPAEFFNWLANVKIINDPGKQFSYSNASYAAAGYLMAFASGSQLENVLTKYEEILQEKILNPIGMQKATLKVSQARKSDDYSVSYILINDKPVENKSYDINDDILAPSGGLKANVEDMALYLMTQINKGVAPNGTRIVSSAALIETWEPILEDYAMGWEVSEHSGLKVISHTGSYDEFASVIGFIPEEKIGFVILTNCYDASSDLIDRAPEKFAQVYSEK